MIFITFSEDLYVISKENETYLWFVDVVCKYLNIINVICAKSVIDFIFDAFESELIATITTLKEN